MTGAGAGIAWGHRMAWLHVGQAGAHAFPPGFPKAAQAAQAYAAQYAAAAAVGMQPCAVLPSGLAATPETAAAAEGEAGGNGGGAATPAEFPTAEAAMVVEMDEVEDGEARAVKRPRLIWTTPLHRRFLDAVDKCGGVEKCLPKGIMKAREGGDGLLRQCSSVVEVQCHAQAWPLGTPTQLATPPSFPCPRRRWPSKA